MTDDRTEAEKIADLLRRDMESVDKLKLAKLRHMARRAGESDHPVFPTGTPCE